MSSLCQYIAFTANDFQSWWRPSFWEASQKVKPIRWKHSTTGHDLGLTVRGNAGEVKNKKPQRWQHLLLGAEGRPNTASCWGAMESWLWAGSPLLLHRWGAGLAHIPHRALKTGTPSGRVRWGRHPHVPETLATLGFSLDSSLRHTPAFEPEDVFSALLRTGGIVQLINFNSYYPCCNRQMSTFWWQPLHSEDKIKALLSLFSAPYYLKRQSPNSALEISHQSHWTLLRTEDVILTLELVGLLASMKELHFSELSLFSYHMKTNTAWPWILKI